MTEYRAVVVKDGVEDIIDFIVPLNSNPKDCIDPVQYDIILDIFKLSSCEGCNIDSCNQMEHMSCGGCLHDPCDICT